ncbi:MAG TPA: PDZ domain-containing protein [Methanosarcinales archaeon]|nr:PDZ domain-containing protein [Methanosarcinales archaeon]
MNALNAAFAILMIYWLFIAILDRRGVLERYNITAFGPILMIRTRRGQSLLSVLARPRGFWKILADVGIPAMLIGMFVMFLLVIMTDYAMLQSIFDRTMPPPGKYNAPQNIFLIPGVNEYIPLVWGAIGLAITLVVHELGHAVLCRVEGVDVKSMGLLTLIVPIGGFAEPDEEQLFGKKISDHSDVEYTKATSGYDRAVRDVQTKSPIREGGVPRRSRMRILAAGVMVNFVAAAIIFLLLFGPVLGAIAPVSNVMIASVKENSAAAQAGIKDEMVITQVDNTTIQTAHDFYAYMTTRSHGKPLTVHVQERQTRKVFILEADDMVLQSGVAIWEVLEDSAASRANLTEDMIITQIDDTPIYNSTDFIAFLNTTVPGQTVEMFFAEDNATFVELGSSPDRSCGYLGVVATTNLEFAGMSIGAYPAAETLHILQKIPAMMRGIEGWLIVFALPFIGFDGTGFTGFSNTMQFYEPVGWAAGYGVLVFWIANALLWTFWINFFAGLFNCLPAVPLDGGHVFRDTIRLLTERMIGDRDAERLSQIMAAAFALLIFGSFAFMIFGPYIVYGL